MVKKIKHDTTKTYYLVTNIFNTTISPTTEVYEINKVSLSCFDDKRYILNESLSSYAYGHYKIKMST